MKVFLVGTGMGNPDTLTVAARRAVKDCDVLVGAERLIAPFELPNCEKLRLTAAADIVSALGRSAAAAPTATAAVLFSGDAGFYSGASRLRDALEAAGGFDVETIPGVSSLQYFCAQLQTTWQDAYLVSAHGRACNVRGAVQAHVKTFVLTGGATKVHDICRELDESGLGDVDVWVGERLSYSDERIVHGSAAELSRESFGDLAVLLALNPRPVTREFAAPALGDDEFARGGAPMTKAEVRSLAVSKLRIASDATVWDVGAGTGSVSVECALAAPWGRVFAVERDGAACELIRLNKERFGTTNLQVVEGTAPRTLAGLPVPDRVFVGGSAGNLEGIVRASVQANAQVRIVISAIVLETLAETLRALADQGLADAEVVSVTVARARDVGGHHMMMGQNPVYLISAGGAR